MKEHDYHEMIEKIKNCPDTKEYFHRSIIGRPRNIHIIRFFERMDRNLKILNVGDGTGTVSLQLEKMGFRDITGTDINKELLSIAKRRCKKTRFVLGDAHKLPFKDRSFDVITYFDCIMLLDAEKTLKEASRVVRAGGRVYIENLNSVMHKSFKKIPVVGRYIKTMNDYRSQSNIKFTKLIKRNGFKILKSGCISITNPNDMPLIKRAVYYTFDKSRIINLLSCPSSYYYLAKK